MKAAENITDADIERLFRVALVIKHQHVLENCDMARRTFLVSDPHERDTVTRARARLARTLNDLEALDNEARKSLAATMGENEALEAEL